MRQYDRSAVDYETWYSDWMKRLALAHTRAELETMLVGTSAATRRAAASHERAIQRTSSMHGNSMARAHTRNVVAASGDRAIALRGALEIHDLFPECSRSADRDTP